MKISNLKLFPIALLLICALLLSSFIMFGDAKRAEAVGPTYYSLTIHYYLTGTETPLADSYSQTNMAAGKYYNVTSPTIAGYSASIDKVEGNISQNKTVTVYYTPNTDTPYTVIHKKENIDGTYSVADTDNLEGTTDALTAAEAKTYEGFTASAFSQQEIKGDGTTEVEILYTRTIYDITYILGAGATNNASNPSTYSVESGLITLYSPARTGYTFAGFAEGNSIAAGSTGDKTFTAQWTLHDPQITGSAGFRGEYDGEEHSVSVIASHLLGQVTYQWYKNSISEENLLEGKTEATLAVKNVSDSGTYYCRVTYTDGTQTKHADSAAIVVSIEKSGLSEGVIVLIIIGALLLLLIAAYIALYIVWKKKDKTPVAFLKMSFRKLNKLLFKTELNDAEILAEKIIE